MATPPMTPEHKEPLERVLQLISLCGKDPTSLSPKDIDFLMKLVETSTHDEMIELIMTKGVHNRKRRSPLQEILGCLKVFDVMVAGHPSVADECFSNDEQQELYCSERPKHEERVNAFYLQCVELGIFVHPSPSP